MNVLIWFSMISQIIVAGLLIPNVSPTFSIIIGMWLVPSLIIIYTIGKRED